MEVGGVDRGPINRGLKQWGTWLRSECSGSQCGGWEVARSIFMAERGG